MHSVFKTSLVDKANVLRAAKQKYKPPNTLKIEAINYYPNKNIFVDGCAVSWEGGLRKEL